MASYADTREQAGTWWPGQGVGRTTPLGDNVVLDWLKLIVNHRHSRRDIAKVLVLVQDSEVLFPSEGFISRDQKNVLTKVKRKAGVDCNQSMENVG